MVGRTSRLMMDKAEIASTGMSPGAEPVALNTCARAAMVGTTSWGRRLRR